MPFLSRLDSLRRNLFTRRRLERDLDDELRTYVDQLADQNRAHESLHAADQAIHLNPALALAHAARACALETSGLAWEAEMESRQAVALAPTDPNRHSDLLNGAIAGRKQFGLVQVALSELQGAFGLIDLRRIHAGLLGRLAGF